MLRHIPTAQTPSGVRVVPSCSKAAAPFKPGDSIDRSHGWVRRPTCSNWVRVCAIATTPTKVPIKRVACDRK